MLALFFPTTTVSTSLNGLHLSTYSSSAPLIKPLGKFLPHCFVYFVAKFLLRLRKFFSLAFKFFKIVYCLPYYILGNVIIHFSDGTFQNVLAFLYAPFTHRLPLSLRMVHRVVPLAVVIDLVVPNTIAVHLHTKPPRFCNRLYPIIFIIVVLIE